VFQAASSIKLLNPYDRTLFRQERGVPFTDVDRYLNAQADLVKSPEVMARASELLKNQLLPGQIRQHVSAEGSTQIFEVTIRASFEDPQQAADVANAVTQAYQDVAAAKIAANVEASVAQLTDLQASLEERLRADVNETERNDLTAQVTDLQAKAGQIRADAAVFGAGVDRVVQASPPEVPISDSPRRKAVIFGLLGFIAALIAAFWRSEKMQVIESPDDAAGSVGAPLLGVLPRHPSDTPAAAAPVLTAPQSAEARQYQFIAASLALITRESHPRALLVTSPEGGTASSITALNLALSAAQDERTAILVDAAGTVTPLLGAEGRWGLSDLVSQIKIGLDVNLRDSLVPVDRLGGLRFVPAGVSSNGRSAAESPHMAKVLANLQQEADLLVIDAPPLLASPGGMKLAAVVDGVVLLVPRGATVQQMRETRRLLTLAKVPLIGYVFDPSRASSRRRTGDSPERQAKNQGRRRRTS
jgi:Mrp family chromosome partitioning ATPase